VFNYAPIRRVRKQLGTTNGGRPLWGGPYDAGRDILIVLGALFVSLGVVGAGFAAFKVIGTVVGLVAAGIIMCAAMYLVGRLRRAGEDFSFGGWIADKVDLHFSSENVVDGPNPFHPDTARRKASKILAPVDVIEDNIVVTGSGRCWAEYRIGNPIEMGLVGEQQQSGVLTEHKALFAKALQRGAYIAHIKEPDSPNELIEQSFTEFDAAPEDIPLYSKLVCDQVDALWETAQTDPGDWPHHLVYVLAIYVGNDETAAAAVRDGIIADLPFTWDLIPATRREMYWVWHSQCVAGVKMTAAATAELPEQLPRIEFDDGAASDSIVAGRMMWLRRKRDLQPVLKITAANGAPSYQTVLTAEIPDELLFPDGTTFLKLLHEMGEPIRWVIRTNAKERENTKTENRTARGILDDNCEELAPFDDNPNLYAREYELLDLYNANLADTQINAVSYTLLISVGAPSAADARRISKGIRDILSPMGIIINDPKPGTQEELWVALQPSAPRSPAMDRHAAETTVPEFAEIAPFTTAAIGHTDGPMIARNLTSGLGEIVRFAAEKLILAGRAAAIAIIASIGGGKSTLGKIMAIFAHLRGDPWGALDRSNIVDEDHPEGIGEWAVLAEVLPKGTMQVIDITNDPPGSVDPLKVWADDPQTAAKHTYNMHVELLEGMSGPDGRLQKLALAEALEPAKITMHGLVSQMALARYLMSLDDPHARLVGRKIQVWQYRPFAAAIFKEELPALTLSARGTVIRTHGLSLPTADKVLNPALNEKLHPEERYATVVYALASVFLKAAFRKQAHRRGRPSYIFVDEAWTVTRNPISMKDILEVDLRESTRKGFTVVVLMTHDAARDLSDEAFQLITTKFLGRAEDKRLAVSNAEWFDSMPVTDDLISDLMAAKNGLFYMSMFNDDRAKGAAEERDVATRRQVARVQVVRPTDAAFVKVLNTTPKMIRREVDDLVPA
jgi:hypothetical protein